MPSSRRHRHRTGPLTLDRTRKEWDFYLATSPGTFSWPRTGLAESEAHEVRGNIAVGYGFSDQTFLARRSDPGSDIYRRVWRSPASWRYPMFDSEAIFECRVDAWMRTSRRTRATLLPAVYDHPHDGAAKYPKARPLRVRTRGKVVRLLAPIIGRLTDSPPFRVTP